MKRVLFISHSFFEPNMGAVRQRRIVRALPDCGWQSAVIGSRPKPADFDGEYFCAPALDLAAWYGGFRRPRATPEAGAARDIRATSLINRWLMVPDKQAPWIRSAVRAGRASIREQRPDLIFASLEPRSNLLVAARLAREFNSPCVMEYRDLWTGSPYYHIAQPTALHRLIHASLERRALRSSTRVTAVSRGIADYLRQAHGIDSRLNYNFYDPSEYPTRTRARDGRFIISYVGAMYFSREPRAFFDGFRKFIDAQKLTPVDITFRWVGSAFSVSKLDEYVRDPALAPFIDIRGQVPHREALQLLVDSDAALILQSPDDRVHIPGKLFEAMGARVPALVLSHPCEVTEIVSRTNAGIVADYDAASVAHALSTLKDTGAAWAFNEAERDRFSSSVAVGRLASLFEEAATCR